MGIKMQMSGLKTLLSHCEAGKAQEHLCPGWGHILPLNLDMANGPVSTEVVYFFTLWDETKSHISQ